MRASGSLGMILISLAAPACAPAGGTRGREQHARAADAIDGSGSSCAVGLREGVPLVIGESFSLESEVLGERRRVNVYVPTVYGEAVREPMGVLCVLDGGMREDFLHIAGLVQVLVSNGTVRPMLVVGVQNTQRRRDMTGPTQRAEDLAIAPEVGGSSAFREFLRAELLPAVRARYSVSDEAAIIGESLAGLFVAEMSVRDPGLFDVYISIDPSLWWNDGALARAAREGTERGVDGARAQSLFDASSAGRVGSETCPRLFIATSADSGVEGLARELADGLNAHAGGRIGVTVVHMADERHATVFHPAALAAFRSVLASERGANE